MFYILTTLTSLWPKAVPQPGHFRCRISKLRWMHCLQKRWKHFIITTCIYIFCLKEKKSCWYALIIINTDDDCDSDKRGLIKSLCMTWWWDMEVDYLFRPIKTNATLEDVFAILNFFLESQCCSFYTLRTQLFKLLVQLHQLFLKLFLLTPVQ